MYGGEGISGQEFADTEPISKVIKRRDENKSMYELFITTDRTDFDIILHKKIC
jgi:hypothetical protein